MSLARSETLLLGCCTFKLAFHQRRVISTSRRKRLLNYGANASRGRPNNWHKREHVCRARGGSVEKIYKATQAALWTMEGVYITWLFLLPYAPGDPVWAISSETVNSLLGLSLNFFFVLPLMNAVGFHIIDGPTLHPASEGLFNFVIGWTLMFGPLLFTDRKRENYKYSLDILWAAQMFLTNVFLIPYMAIRMSNADIAYPSRDFSPLQRAMTKGSRFVGLTGGAVCLGSALWVFVGREDCGFGGISDRWEFLMNYIASERLAYAFIWDIGLYIIFQPWLIGDNLQNVDKNKVSLIKTLRFVPVFGLVAYLLCLDFDTDPDEPTL